MHCRQASDLQFSETIDEVSVSPSPGDCSDAKVSINPNLPIDRSPSDDSIFMRPPKKVCNFSLSGLLTPIHMFSNPTYLHQAQLFSLQLL